MNGIQKYRFACTLNFGDVYGQIIVWLIVIFLSLATALALMGARQPVFALATVGLILVLSLPPTLLVEPGRPASPSRDAVWKVQF